MRVHWRILGVAILLAGLGGCAMENVGAASVEVHGGTPSSHQSVGLLFTNLRAGEACTTSGAFISPRHFIVSGCDDGSSDLYVSVPDGNPEPMTIWPSGIVHEAPSTGVMMGGDEVVVRILDTHTRKPITVPTDLATVPPRVGDTLTLVGFGDDTGNPDFSQVTEGPVRVTRVTDNGAEFSFVGIDDVRPCDHDTAVFGPNGNLVGLAVSGTPDPDHESCFAEVMAVSLAPLVAWADEVLAIPIPEPSYDAGPNPGPNWEFNWGCAANGGGAEGAGWIFAFLGLLVWRGARRSGPGGGG
jgi:hypothetical protein